MELLKKSRAFLLLFVTFFFWGSVYVGGKLISDDVPAPLLGCLRCFVASFPLMLMARKHFGVKIDRADWKYFAGVGVMGYFLTIFLIQLGISLTGASMASLVNSVTPVGVTIFAALHLKEKITPTKVLCLVLALVGGWLADRQFTAALDTLADQAVLQHQRNLFGYADTLRGQAETEENEAYE
mgnify:FL=1